MNVASLLDYMYVTLAADVSIFDAIYESAKESDDMSPERGEIIAWYKANIDVADDDGYYQSIATAE